MIRLAVTRFLSSEVANRAFDLSVAVGTSVALCPILGLVATGVYFVDGPPVLFRQRRVGRYGRDFTIFKFRTMRRTVGGEARFDAGDTSRVTKLGAVLRATKLDELPQLWNVIKGEMAVIGPRPEIRRWVEAFPDRWVRIHSVRPGLSDPASIRFRHEERILSKSSDPERTYREKILPLKLEMYEQYVERKGLPYDLACVVDTLLSIAGLPAMLTDRQTERQGNGSFQ